MQTTECETILTSGLENPYQDQAAHLLHMGRRSLSQCMRFGWWFSLCETSGPDSWFCRFTCGIPDASITLSPFDFNVLLQLFHKTPQTPLDIWLWVCTFVSMLCWMKPHRSVILSFCLQAHQNITNDAKDCLSPTGWVSSLASCWVALPLMSVPFLTLNIL